MRPIAVILLISTFLMTSLRAAPQTPAEKRAEIARLQQSIATLRPKIKVGLEAIRLETLSAYPFEAPVFVALGHQVLRRLFVTLNKGASGSGTISVGAANLRYNWTLDKFELKSVGDRRVRLLSHYSIDIPGCCKCNGVIQQSLKWESRMLVPSLLQAECKTPRGEFSVQINPDELAIPLPFTLALSIRFAPNIQADISGSLYFGVSESGVIFKGDHLRVKPR